MSYIDTHPDILEWQSEELIIPYRSPIDGLVHRYFPDFVIKKRSANGKIETVIVEIKPRSQTVPPTPSKKKTKQYLYEVHTWAINDAKWKAARAYCEKKGWRFQIMTENELGLTL